MLILEETGKYCARLEKAVFDYVCNEKTVEKVYYTHLAQDYRSKFPTAIQKTEKHTYLYEVQYIRKDGKIHEDRTLIKKDGKEYNRQHADLETLSFEFGKIIFGPVALLGKRRQSHYDYQIISEDKLGQDKTVVIQATPDPTAENHCLYGKIWVRISDFAVLKIEWSEKSIQNSQEIVRRARELGADPRFTIVFEFDVEKNGIRFPSRVRYEEAYTRGDKKKIVKSHVTVDYENYKFFTVDVDVDYN
ncbi:MAG: hypothetical protein JXB23_13375 [Candidatus Aminicenantes bacterium]|nr:hypothetical protein [Candidatus Aminicenantes bacterium]